MEIDNCTFAQSRSPYRCSFSRMEESPNTKVQHSG